MELYSLNRPLVVSTNTVNSGQDLEGGPGMGQRIVKIFTKNEMK